LTPFERVLWITRREEGVMSEVVLVTVAITFTDTINPVSDHKVKWRPSQEKRCATHYCIIIICCNWDFLQLLPLWVIGENNVLGREWSDTRAPLAIKGTRIQNILVAYASWMAALTKLKCNA
jgi:hypothetical protein